MAKQKPEITIVSYGIYTQWDEKSKKLPQVTRFELTVPARLDIEFGFIVNIKKAKNKKVLFKIDHPKIPDDNGKPMAPFTGEVYVKNNDWDFFLGDTIWEPVENKVGPWHLSLTMDGKVIAEKTFNIIEDDRWTD